MSRLYHSPSSLSSAMGETGCIRAWAYRYLAEIQDPEPEWATYANGLPSACGHDSRLVDPRNGQCRKCRKLRSKALGMAVHLIGQATYTSQPLPRFDDGLPLAVWASGATLLPHPANCIRVEVEAEIGAEAIESEHFTRAMRVGPVLLAGKRDLTAWSHASEGPGVDWPWLLDYKTTSNIPSYAKSPEQLTADLQCNVYALDLMRRTRARTQACRWVYFETKDKRRAFPVGVTIERARAEDIVGAAAEFAARELDPLERVKDALCNTMACGAYGGCMLHESVGGPCNARRRAGALIQMLTRGTTPAKEGRKMASAKFDRSKYAHLQAKPDGAAAPAAATEAAPAAATGAAPAVAVAPVATEAAPAAAPARRRGRPAKAPAVTPEAAPAPINVLDAIKALVAERDAAIGRVQAIEAKLGEARAALTAALGEEQQ